MIEVSVADEVSPLEPEWDALALQLRAGPFVSPDWIAAHWSAFGSGRLAVITVRREGALGAVLPLALRRRAARSPTNAHSPQFGLLSADRELTTHAVRAALQLGSSRLALSYVDRDSPLAVAVRDHARQQDRLVAERVMLRSPYVELQGTSAEYWAALRRSFRTDLGRRNRRLHEQGDVQLELHEGPSNLDALLAEGWRLESSGWKQHTGTTVTAHPSTERFYRDVAHRAAGRGRLALLFLRLDGRALAFMFGLRQDEILYLLKAGFDPEYARFSPGQLLQQRVIEMAFATGLVRVEMLGGDEPYKLAWTDKVRELVSVQCFARSPARRAHWVLLAHGRPIAVRVGLDRVARTLRDAARARLHAARARADWRIRGS